MSGSIEKAFYLVLHFTGSIASVFKIPDCTKCNL